MSLSYLEVLMKRNKPLADAFQKNKNFRKLLIALYLAASEEAGELGCELKDIEVVDQKMSPDGRKVFWKFKKRVEEEKPKSSIINPNTGKDLRFQMAETIDQLLSGSLRELAMKNESIGSFYMALVGLVTEKAREKVIPIEKVKFRVDRRCEDKSFEMDVIYG